MNENTLKVSDELLQNLSAEQLVDLKMQVDDLLLKIDNALETCNEIDKICSTN